MRVLFFAWTPLDPHAPVHGYGGGGWIEMLQRELNAKGVELGYTYLSETDEWYKYDGYSYYGVKSEKKSLKEKVLVGLNPKDISYEARRDAGYMQKFQKVIEDFNPDIIHVFGSEMCYGLITKYTEVPVVIHLQGILNVYWNAYLTPGVSLATYCLQSLNLKNIWSKYQQYWEWYRTCAREREILKNCKYFIGRTDWDKGCVSILAKGYRYFYGSEMLRTEYHNSLKREMPPKLTIVTTSSAAIYKGFDIILKTAKVLKERLGDDFIWKVFGNVEPKFYEKILHIKHEDVNVKLCGVGKPQEIVDTLSQSTLYFHSSYIENSPNSVCEAQLCGCPIIAQDVGGISSIVAHGEDGFLIPANDPYMGASRIIQLYEAKELNQRMGGESRKSAQKRHDREAIVTGLIETYKQIIESEAHE